MAFPDAAFARARDSYEMSHLSSAARGVAIAALLVWLAVILHPVTNLTFAMAVPLAVALSGFGWRGGAWRRGALAGVGAGLPPMIVPIAVGMLSSGGHCIQCSAMPTWICALACFGTSSFVGALVGGTAALDCSPRRYASAALVTAALTGMVGCVTMGFGGAVGVVAGLAAGGATGWYISGRVTA